RGLAVRQGRWALVWLGELLEQAAGRTGGARGRLSEEDRGMTLRLRGDLPGLRQSDLLLERIPGGAATRAHVRHRLRVGDEAADVAFDLRDRVERIDPGHHGRVGGVRAGDRLQLRQLGPLATAEFLE